MDWFNPKSFSCDVKKATFFLSATVDDEENDYEVNDDDEEDDDSVLPELLRWKNQ